MVWKCTSQTENCRRKVNLKYHGKKVYTPEGSKYKFEVGVNATKLMHGERYRNSFGNARE